MKAMWRRWLTAVMVWTAALACNGDADRSAPESAVGAKPSETATDSKDGQPSPGAPTEGANSPTQAPESPPTQKDGTPAPANAAPDLPPAREGMVWVTGTVNNLAGRAVRPRGAKDSATICVHGQGDLPCVEADGQGKFAIQVPQHAEVALLFRGEYLTNTLRAFVTTDRTVELGNSRIPNEQGLAPIAKAQRKRIRKGRGGLFFGGMAGTTTSLESASGKPASGELFFTGFRDQLLPDEKAVPMHGTGGYYNVRPGVVRVRFAKPGAECSFRADNTFSGWPDPSSPDVARVPVLPGHLTHLVTMPCLPVAAPASAGGATGTPQ